MSLTRVVYYSEALDGDALNIDQLLAISYRNNRRDRITGFLLLNEGYFLQTLEGSRTHVNALYARILRDGRHKNVTLMQFVDIKKRLFPSWSMGFHSGADGTASRILEQYFSSSRLDPSTADPDCVVEALTEIATIAAQKAEAHLSVDIDSADG